jgi:hypothetical protein
VQILEIGYKGVAVVPSAFSYGKLSPVIIVPSLSIEFHPNTFASISLKAGGNVAVSLLPNV